MDKFTLNLNPRTRYTFTVCDMQTGEVDEQLAHIKSSALENEINYLEENFPGKYFYDIREEYAFVEECPYVGLPVDVFTQIVDTLSRNGNEKALRLLVGHALIKGGHEA